MKSTLFSLVLSLLLFSCTKEKPQANPAKLLETDWKLVKVECYCTPSPTPNGAQVYRFGSDGVLQVENQGESVSPSYGEAGVFDYVLGEETVAFNNRSFVFSLSAKTLTLTYQDAAGLADDEVRLELEAL